VDRVVVGLLDPDPQVTGRGIAALRAAGLEVATGVCAGEVERQLLAYLHHRRTGRPYVVCKVAATLDGATAAPDGTSQWITGEQARRDAHQLRAESDAILVGAGTVRADDPSLTVRLVDGPDPRRVVLGTAPKHARVHPCLEWEGDLGALLDQLGREGVLQLMVEGGSRVIGSFHDADLVDRYVVYLAPALLGGTGGAPLISGNPAPTIPALRRGRVDAVARVGDDVRIDFVPDRSAGQAADDQPRGGI
jgi:diaminohydroxyphosphoribosylaminopyrimidine deaminase/5-amino-6-(5-phosphoribosylamino)uracil reductase